MKKIFKQFRFFLIAFIILTITVFVFLALNNKSKGNNYKKEFVKRYTIDYLREKEFGSQKIKIEKKLGNKGKFKSYIISYLSEDIKQYALLNIPIEEEPEKGYPVVIVNHGYIRPDKYSTENSYKLVSSYFSSNGFLVLKPDYRGHDKSETAGGIPFNRFSYTEDVLYLLNALLSIKEADNENIFVYGHSMGGDITLRMLEITDRIKAATLWAPVCVMFPESLLFFLRRRSEVMAKSIKQIIGSIFEEEDYPKVSAISNIKYIKTPIILHHGTEDESVPYEWSLNLIKEFNTIDTDYVFYTYKGEDHNFAKTSFYDVLKRDVEFFKSKLY